MKHSERLKDKANNTQTLSDSRLASPRLSLVLQLLLGDHFEKGELTHYSCC